jgi:CheY-like chemotaxis protein
MINMVISFTENGVDMPVLYVIHPEEDERSKIHHILGGRDYILKEFSNGAEASESLEGIFPDVCLMTLAEVNDGDPPFEETLHKAVNDCPIILLASRMEITDAVALVGEHFIFDYFLTHPVVDPMRLHMMIYKALTQSAIELNMAQLKAHVSEMPSNLPEMIESHTSRLERGLINKISTFKERMKSSEFEDIVNLLDVKAFDDKFNTFNEYEIRKTIEESRDAMSEALVTRLNQFSMHVQQQIDDPPKFEELMDLRKKLYGTTPRIENLKQDLGDLTVGIASGIANQAKKTALFLDDEVLQTDGMTKLLESMGLIVVAATSPKKFLELAKSREFDLVICGHHLGNTTGIELIRRMKEDTGRYDTPAIMLTDDPSKKVQDEASDAGIGELIKMPVLPKILEAKIKRYL